MKWLKSENPGHVHIRSLRMRLTIPLILGCTAVLGIAAFAVYSLVGATAMDGERAAYSLARAAATNIRLGSAPEKNLPEGAIFHLVDARGMVMKDSLPSSIGSKLNNDKLLVEIFSKKDGSVSITDSDGVRRLYGFAQATNANGVTDFAVVGMPAEAVFASVNKMLFYWAFLGTFLALLALGLAIALGDILLVRRTNRLVSAMRRVVSGEAEAKQDLVHGLGELDSITELFETVTEKLQQAYATTETKVQSRTVELAFNKGMAELDKARMEALLASVGDGLIATDNEGKITFVNQEGEHMLGFTSEELITNLSHSFMRLEDDKGAAIPPESRPTEMAVASGKKYASPVYPKPYYYVRKDKTRFPAQITVTPVIAGGVNAGTIQVFRDITAEVEFDRRKSEFISIASHQLRAPLSAVKWLTEMLRAGDVGKLEQKQQELADKLFEANERMVVLVNELLNVSRLESGTIKLSPQEMSISKLVDTVLVEMTPNLSQRKQTFEKSLGEVPSIIIDPTLMREVTANIISNASKYSPEGSVVSVGVRLEGEEIIVSVKDQGMGIPQSDQSQMFKKFFRAENASKSVVTGTGLGLYVCKAIIELHGGRVWFESSPDKGTTFFYALPLKGVPIKAGEINLT